MQKDLKIRAAGKEKKVHQNTVCADNGGHDVIPWQSDRFLYSAASVDVAATVSTHILLFSSSGLFSSIAFSLAMPSYVKDCCRLCIC